METLKLKRSNRFTYRGMMYTKDKPFRCRTEMAEDLLGKRDLRGRPLFVRCLVKKRTSRSPEPDVPVIEEVEPSLPVEIVDETGDPVVEDTSPIIEEFDDSDEDEPEEVSEDDISDLNKVEV